MYLIDQTIVYMISLLKKQFMNIILVNICKLITNNIIFKDFRSINNIQTYLSIKSNKCFNYKNK